MNLFRKTFRKKNIKQHLIIILLSLTSILIIPSFTLLGYVFNGVRHAKQGNILEVAEEKGLVELTKEGFIFAIFLFMLSIFFQIFAALVGIVLAVILTVFSISIYSLPFLILISLVLLFLLAVYDSMVVAYCKNDSIVKAFSSDIFNYLKEPRFYLYVILSPLILFAFSMTIIGLGIGLVLSYGVLGLVISEDAHS